jgi:HYR domain
VRGAAVVAVGAALAAGGLGAAGFTASAASCPGGGTGTTTGGSELLALSLDSASSSGDGCSTSTAESTRSRPSSTTSPDTTPPALAGVPSDLTVEATGPAGAPVDYALPSAYDNQDGPVAVACTPPPGSTFPLGTTTVVCRAGDAAGNVGSASFTVTVVDTTPPALTLPGALTLHSWFRRGRRVYYTAGATDVVDGAVEVSCSPPSGSLLPAGVVFKVSCSATDAHHNTVTGSFTVEVVFPSTTES